MENNTNNYTKSETASDHQILLITVILATLLLSLYGKLLSFGWLTILLIWFPILPIHFIAFTKTGIKLALVKNKNKSDYIHIFALCITMLLYTFTFVDAGDMSTNTAIDIIDSNILSTISIICFFINVILIIKHSKKKKMQL